MKSENLYIQLFNIHGLFRSHDLELGRDADTGGQTKYVLELALSLSKRPEVEKVEVLTRYISDKAVSRDYSRKNEKVNDKLSIIRIGCGGGKYIKKENLWDHLEEFVDKTIKYIKSNKRVPDIIHSHYADAGYVCSQLSAFFGIPLVHTGHSLGKDKLEHLLNNNMKREEIERRYKISRRIDAENRVNFYADKIITSTSQEISAQYGKYEYVDKNKFNVIPPGIDLEKFYAFSHKREWNKTEQQLRNNIQTELYRFFINMSKPIILALCRPEKRKNISGLIQAYGESKSLQEKANLAIFAGIRKDIQQMPDIEQEVLTEMLLLMDKYNLYGKMAIPKKHDFEHEVPELYRIVAETRGVFVNSAYNEPFGLTLIEAAASGLPIVATDDGGPKDIVSNLQNGILVDVNNSANISDALIKLIGNNKLWNKYSQNGIDRVYNFYSWEAHANQYMELVKQVMEKTHFMPKTFIATGRKLLESKKLMIFDIDETITGDEEALHKLSNVIENMDPKIGFGIATGRTIDSALEVLRENNFVDPDLIISSVGSEIYYKDHDKYIYSSSWDAHIKEGWKPERIKKELAGFDFLELQEEETQRKFKISYYIDGEKHEIQPVKEKLQKSRIKANLILSHNQFVDILPFRASKGRAIRYLSYRWNIPLDSILTAGDSGNDEDMLTGDILGVVVNNHSPELKTLMGRKNIYFAEKKHAAGIIEGIENYKFME